MNKKNLKKFAAVTLAATMAFGSAMTVFADDAAEGVAEGSGSYEGGEMKYPALSVTLPTIPAGTYDYIADPNGLIAATSNSKYSGASFTGNTGIFFQTSANTYTEKSAAQTVTNENAQDVDITVKLEQKTAGDAIIKYSNTATFEAEDKANKLYLAVTDDDASNPNVAALSANAAAVVTATVQGVKDNYEAAYANGKYEYTKKNGATGWKDCSFILTGAINTNATWGDDVTFPEIKVTWSYKEHTDSALSSQTISQSSNSLTVTDATVTGVTLVKANGSRVACTAGTHYTFSNGTLTVMAGMLGNNVGGTIEISLSTGETETVRIQ